MYVCTLYANMLKYTFLHAPHTHTDLHMYMYVYHTPTHSDTHTHMRACINTHASTHARTYARTHAHTHTHTHTQQYTDLMYVRITFYTYVHTYILTYINTCNIIHIYICAYFMFVLLFPIGIVYTGTKDGRIWKIVGNKLVEVTRFHSGMICSE